MIERVKLYVGFFLFLVGFYISYLSGVYSLKSEIFVDAQEIFKHIPRDVAAIKKEIKPNGPLLLPTTPESILAKAQLSQSTGNPILKLVLGHFSTKIKSSQYPVFACQAYDSVILTYEATVQNSPSTESPSPVMQIETTCVMDPEDLLHLKPINFNPKLIVKEPPAEGLKTAEDGSYTLRFENMDTQAWPNRWKFISVQFKDTKKGEAPIIQLDREKLANNQNKLDLAW